ncbi:MAG: methionine biosynthesis protein MetW [Rickettsiales bacterium]|nr:methionine biosynthesis protein MetW [Rickettsiales bacterium]
MRKDYQIFFDYIKPNSKVLDIGCGDGDFLQKLKLEKNTKSYGIEISSEKVAECLNKGLSVINGDAEEELKFYPSTLDAPEPFDYAVLANTLQVMKNPKVIIEQAKRISKNLLISIPNFGYFENRLYIGLKGKMPMSKQLSYKWYETPNIHFSTILDFIELLKELNLEIKKSFYIKDSAEVKPFKPFFPYIANLTGKEAVFVI